MKLFTALMPAIAFVALAPLLAAAPDVRFEPVSKWNVHHADDSCRLLRQFGDKADPVTLIFDRFGPGDDFQFSMSGTALRRFSGGGTTQIQFGPNESVQRLDYLSGTMGEKIPAIFVRGTVRLAPLSNSEKETMEKATIDNWVDIAPIGTEREAAVTELRFGRKGPRQMTFVLGSMNPPFKVLNTCLDKLLETWGVDAARQRAAKRPAVPLKSPGTWLTSDDYPRDEAGKGAQGLVNFRLSVDESGKATACHIQQSTRSESFDEVVCKAMMRRAKFSPALDADGKPFPSFYRNSVVFVMRG